MNPALDTWEKFDQEQWFEFLKTATGQKVLHQIKEHIRPHRIATQQQIHSDAVSVIGAIAAARYEGGDSVIAKLEDMARPPKQKKVGDLPEPFSQYYQPAKES